MEHRPDGGRAHHARALGLGILANNIWSFAGPSDRAPVNQLMAQYFINYNFPDGSYISSSPIITANWLAKGGERWTVPVGGGIGRLFMVQNQPVDVQFGVYYNLRKPELASRWQFRFNLSLLFPNEGRQRKVRWCCARPPSVVAIGWCF